MNYQFECHECGASLTLSRRPFRPPPPPSCDCGLPMYRVYGCEIDTSGCRDHDYIPPEKRVVDTTDRRGELSKERAFQQHIKERRDLVAAAGHNPNSIRQTHSVPADLFHGKIRETGDRNYWNDPGNVKKHSSCKVD